METAIRDAIWKMLASDYSPQQIKDSFSLVDIDTLIDEVNEEFGSLEE